MGHAVHYLDATGASRFELQPTLDAALEAVERLRNDGSSSDVRVFKEVPIQVRTYYKVVVADGEDGAPASEEVVEAPVVTEVVADAEVAVDATEPVVEPTAEPAAEVEDLEAARAERAAQEPLSGAVVMTPPPVTLHPEAEELDEHVEPRRPLFSRG
jgi:hypothetical protein